MPVPASLISPLRSALASQGFPSSSVDEAGNINPGAILSGAYNKVTVRTRLFPPIPLNTANALSSEPGWVTKLIQPAVVFEGQFGKSTYAPWGDPGQNIGWLATTAIVLGLMGIGYAIGRSKR